MKVLLSLLGIGIACQAPFAAHAQGSAFPSKTIHLLVGAPPGGSQDVIARVIAQKMSDTLGQQVVVDNKPGAGGTLATGLAAKSPADGYTWVVTPSAHAFAPSMYEKLPFDPVKDFESGGQIGRLPLVVLANKSLPANSMKELVELARAKPGTINFGSGGSGSPQHLAGELLKSVSGVQMSHVPYKGTGPAMTDLIGGQIQLLIEPIISALPQVQGGRVKALATTGARRAPAMPEVPTVSEAGLKDMEMTAWYGLLTPAGTPADAVAKVNAALNKTLAEPAAKASLEAQGLEVMPGTPQQFMELVSSEIARWKPVIQKASIKAD